MRALFKNMGALVLAFSFGAAGLWGKTENFSTTPENLRTLDAAHIEQTMRSKGVFLRRVSSITANGDYAALRFVASTCDGAIDIVPLYRNAEGQDLLGSRSGPTQSAIAFDGRLYDTFPAFRYWVAEAGYALQLTSRPPLYSRALALREAGNCGLMALAAAMTRPGKTAAN